MSTVQTVTYDEALTILDRLRPPSRTEMVPTTEALYRTLAMPALARVTVPPFHRAMMDGYAISQADISDLSGKTLPVRGVIGAGQTECYELDAGSAVKVMTGAPVPDGTVAVVRKEWCETSPDGRSVTFLESVQRGESVQQAGEDGRVGDPLLTSGTRLRAQDIAVLAAFGVRQVAVHQRLRVGIVTTGSEIVTNLDASLEPSQIYGSNGVYLQLALRDEQCEVPLVQHVPDDPQQLEDVVRSVAGQVDVVLLTGGVSAGDYDYVPGTLRRICKTLAMERVWMRPGAPFVAATHQSTVFFAMSGNPAAAFIQFETLVRPTLSAMAGRPYQPFALTAKLADHVAHKPVKHTRFLRARAAIEEGQLVVHCARDQSPGLIKGLAHTNAIVRMDSHHAEVGQHLSVQMVSSFRNDF
jgi:molybdenum cofactor synthesis domain-containing protein